jgi:hypothetical protein
MGKTTQRLRGGSHHKAVFESAKLSNWHRWMWHRMATVNVELKTVLQALQAKKIPFVLTGAHGISGWTDTPRATQDVDILVKSGRNHARAVKALRAIYPQLEVHHLPGVTVFVVPGEKKSVIDVSHPHRPDIEETLRTAIWVGEGTGRYRIPALEAALANKYGAMLNPTRDPGKRGQDAVDFYRMVQHSADARQQSIDLAKLADLGEKVWPGGGGDEILGLVEQARAGKVPNTGTPRGR